MRRYFGRESITVEDAIKKYGLEKSYIIELLDAKYIGTHDFDFETGEIVRLIDFDDQQKLKVLSDHPEYRDKVLSQNPSYYYDYCPELIGYHPFHDFLDRFCWLIKLFYSENNDIKKKKYRLDVLFQQFLIKNKFSLNKLSKKLISQGNDEKLIFHLQKGWYNELVRSLPLNKNFLDIGTNSGGPVADSSAISWNITQSYYSVYEYTNALCFLFEKDIDTARHKISTKIFNNSILDKLKGCILFYPFSLSVKNAHPNKYPKYAKFKYACYPRDRDKLLPDVNDDVVSALKKISKQNTPACFVNYLFEFRVWANYLGIEAIIKLKNGHLLQYLYKNLAIVTFFTGGIAELSAIAKLGEQKYVETINNFVSNYVLKQPQYEKNILLIPIFIRHRIYKNLNIISADLPYLSPMYDDPIIMISDNRKDVAPDIDGLKAKLKSMSINEIAQFIIDDWSKQGKVPKEYLEPMLKLRTLKDNYGAESAPMIISYFIANSKGWQGKVSRITKRYLIEMLEGHSQNR